MEWARFSQLQQTASDFHPFFTMSKSSNPLLLWKTAAAESLSQKGFRKVGKSPRWSVQRFYNSLFFQQANARILIGSKVPNRGQLPCRWTRKQLQSEKTKSVLACHAFQLKRVSKSNWNFYLLWLFSRDESGQLFSKTWRALKIQF